MTKNEKKWLRACSQIISAKNGGGSRLEPQQDQWVYVSGFIEGICISKLPKH